MRSGIKLKKVSFRAASVAFERSGVAGTSATVVASVAPVEDAVPAAAVAVVMVTVVVGDVSLTTILAPVVASVDGVVAAGVVASAAKIQVDGCL